VLKINRVQYKSEALVIHVPSVRGYSIALRWLLFSIILILMSTCQTRLLFFSNYLFVFTLWLFFWSSQQYTYFQKHKAVLTNLLKQIGE
jgi:hypothetical protein